MSEAWPRHVTRLMRVAIVCAVVSATVIAAGCGSSNETRTTTRTTSFGSVEADFVSALLLHDARRASALVDPRFDARTEAIEGLVDQLRRDRVPLKPQRVGLRHNCESPITVCRQR